MTNCMIIDDEPDAINLLSDYIAQVPELRLVQYSTRAAEMLTYLEQNPIRILFLDVNMPQISGIAFIQLARQVRPDIQIILTTAYAQYAVSGFDHQVADYLLKPISFERFLQAVQRANGLDSRRNGPGSNNFFFVKGGNKNRQLKINMDEIQFIEGLEKYVSIYLTNGERVIALQNMKDLERLLPRERFRRVHRSHILPIRDIKSVDGNRIFVHSSERVFDIGKTYRDGMTQFLKDNGIA